MPDWLRPNSMKWIAFLFALLLASSASAQTTRLQLLQEQRNQAIERTVIPINAKYVQELEKLLKTTIAAGDLDEAVKIREGIQKFQAEAVTAPVEEAQLTQVFSERWLIGTKWAWMDKDSQPMRGEFRKGTFDIYHQEDDGDWVLKEGTWKWEIVSEEERKVTIHWYSGPETVQFSEDLKSIDGSKENWIRYEE